MKSPHSLTVPPAGQIAFDPQSEKPVYFGFDYNGDPLVLIVRGHPQFREHDGTFVRTVFREPHDFVVSRLVGGTLTRTVIQDRRENLQFVQPFPSGELLLVGARCHLRNEGAEKNALIADATGQIRSSFTLGDGIQDVQVNSADEIWVSYFDEGIFGNYGWTEPLGARGLTQWLADGRCVFEFDPPSGLDHPADCYALNVATDGVWFCYYTDFPLVCLREGKIESWTTSGYGSHGLAVDDPIVAFLGSYKYRDRLFVCLLENGLAIEKTCYRLQFDNGTSVAGQLAAARNANVGFFSDGLVSVLDVKTLETEAR